MKAIYTTSLLISICIFSISAQRIHSHNDYEQNVPFWKAYSVGASSIEADVFLKNNRLYVAHLSHEIKKTRTLRSLYLKPIEILFSKSLMQTRPFQLLIDIKTEAYSTLNKIIEELDPLKQHLYPNNPKGVKVVISGGRPKSADYDNYPDFIFFDWQAVDYPENEDRVALVSLNFNNCSKSDGQNPLTDKEEDEIKSVIAKMKKLNKPIRFWASPDTELGWKTLHKLGVDYIGTDKPIEATLLAFD